MGTSNLKRWEREFRSAAKSDNLVLFEEYLHRLGLTDEAEKLLQGTVLAVQACCAYARLDGQSTAQFLAMQKYHPADADDVSYTFTFDLCGKAFARVLGSVKGGILDLADLYGHPWSEYEVCGYSCFWVSRTDGKKLSSDELMEIEREITEDLRFDYTYDELDFWFDETAIEGVLLVNLMGSDRFEDEDEGED
jgi:hypothetical protein